MITIDEYKKILIDYFLFETDDTDEKKRKRRLELSSKYSDYYLGGIIEDTHSYIKDVLNNPTSQEGYYLSPLDGEKIEYISLGLDENVSSDILIKDQTGRLISKRILVKVFGSQIYFGIRKESIPLVLVDGLITEDFKYQLQLNTLPNNLKQIKEKLFGKSIKRTYRRS